MTEVRKTWPKKVGRAELCAEIGSPEVGAEMISRLRKWKRITWIKWKIEGHHDNLILRALVQFHIHGTLKGIERRLGTRKCDVFQIFGTLTDIDRAFSTPTPSTSAGPYEIGIMRPTGGAGHQRRKPIDPSTVPRIRKYKPKRFDTNDPELWWQVDKWNRAREREDRAFLASLSTSRHNGEQDYISFFKIQ